MLSRLHKLREFPCWQPRRFTDQGFLNPIPPKTLCAAELCLRKKPQLPHLEVFASGTSIAQVDGTMEVNGSAAAGASRVPSASLMSAVGQVDVEGSVQSGNVVVARVSAQGDEPALVTISTDAGLASLTASPECAPTGVSYSAVLGPYVTSGGTVILTPGERGQLEIYALPDREGVWQRLETQNNKLYVRSQESFGGWGPWLMLS